MGQKPKENKMQIKATANVPAKVNGGKALVESVNVDIPSTLEGMSKKFTVEYITDLAKKALIIQYQAFMRGKMVKKEENEIVAVGLKGAALQAAVDAYKPTLRKAGKSFLDKVREKAKGMSDEEKRALLAELTGKSGGSAPSVGGAAGAPRRAGSTPTRRTAA